MLKNWKSEKGYTGIDVAIAIVILFVFTLMISTLFVNIYMQYTDSQRSSVAMSYLTSVSELIDKMYFQYVSTEQNQNDPETLENRLTSLFSNYNLTFNRSGSQLEVVFSNGYKLTIDITLYRPNGDQSEDLVKNVTIESFYKVNNVNKSIKIEKIKAKEILITPNRPQLPTGLVPVKYITTNIVAGEGYWQVTTENDTTWYNYDNKVWASAMPIDGLIVEGEIYATEDNIVNLVGKRIIHTTPMFTWIPRFVSSNNNVTFLYSTSNKIVDSNGYLQNIANISVNNAFNEITGFWIANSYYNNVDNSLSNADSTHKSMASALAQSQYGTSSYQQIFSNIIGDRKIIIVR